ncbi:hypothetical protein AS189_02840 [Arthrobacter alpinus]|uniref:Uncharacterized protein n=1 Tax=Arthrobacter alpinus TaxID=656366 RepID=A0A0S2LW19_9MICC|nr:hypothetical protein [Arthrobacter alpinus]ALO65621.1 hypothetical protein AS189_02840 [Arthrobacter alpinus]
MGWRPALSVGVRGAAIGAVLVISVLAVVGAVDLAQAIPNISFSVGPGWWLVLAFGIGAVAWSFAMVGHASARTRGVAKTRNGAAVSTVQAPIAPSTVPGAWNPAGPQTYVNQKSPWER